MRFLKVLILVALLFLLTFSFGGCAKNSAVLADEILQEEITGEIRVSGYYPTDQNIRNAALKFERKYPGVKVILESFSPPYEVSQLAGNPGIFVGETAEDKQREAVFHPI
ncbi:MAG: hypothetical protein LBS21_09970 [Clostridiales bacterium]|jgi:ABC-type glycerol-3-phosphate transport system substrate-binding protein|nr:hypothetical protein [Clostridiales bacterium]